MIKAAQNVQTLNVIAPLNVETFVSVRILIFDINFHSNFYLISDYEIGLFIFHDVKSISQLKCIVQHKQEMWM